MAIKSATAEETAALGLAQREGWPAELRVLAERYPREVWAGHANLGAMAQFWLARHDMFRQLAASLEAGTARFRAGESATADYPQWFAPRLQFFLEQLHAHHQIEDFHYFPIFRAADERLARGFDVLEADHVALHHDIERSVAAANAMLRALANNTGVSDADALRRAGDDYAAASGPLLKGLARHLEDEEDIIVPLILARGEDALGVGH